MLNQFLEMATGIFNFFYVDCVIQEILGVIHIVRTHKGGRERSSQLHVIVYKGGRVSSIAYVRKKKYFLDHKISKLFFFCAKEAITLAFIIVYRKG